VAILWNQEVWEFTYIKRYVNGRIKLGVTSRSGEEGMEIW
jgi:hypothetical protein